RTAGRPCCGSPRRSRRSRIPVSHFARNRTMPSNPKLGQLLRLLASDKDGEVVAAARAITKLLKKEGKDWHHLADKLGGKAAASSSSSSSNGSARAEGFWDNYVWPNDRRERRAGRPRKPTE